MPLTPQARQRPRPTSVPRRPARWPARLALALGLLAIGPHVGAHASDPVEEIEAFTAGGQTGALLLPAGAPDRRTPVVVILPDLLGPDGRSAVYVEQLAGGGFAVLDLFSSDGADLGLVLERLRQHPRILAEGISLLGFGAGARIAAAWPGPVDARVLLYPGCAGLLPAPMVGERVLLLHGDADPANPPRACEALAASIGQAASTFRRRSYAGASYAWDRPSFGVEWVSLLPAPGMAGRVPSVSWPELAALSATEVAGFLATRVSGAGP